MVRRTVRRTGRQAHSSFRWWWALVATAAIGVGCETRDPAPTPVPHTGEAPPAPAPGVADAATIDRLRALGYVGFAEEKVDPTQASPVTAFDAERSAPGYSLISNRDLTTAQLVDPLGKVVRSWRDENARHWSNAELLDGGDLLVTGSEEAGDDADGRNFLLRLSWNGDTVWRARINAHHDAERTPDGRIAALTFHLRSIPAIDPEVAVKDHAIAILSDSGELLEEQSLYDMLAAAPALFRFQPVGTIKRKHRPFIDLLHANSLEFMPHLQLVARGPLYAPGNVLVSFRHQDTIAIFDWPGRRLVWAWGQGEISGQHDATWLPNGNLLLFDNGLARGWSRVIELDPLARKIVWEYRAPEPRAFFSLRKGSSQRLENGNTLVANSDSGEAFEVTPKGDVVWRFLNPNSDEAGHRATIVRIKRYPQSFVAALLEPPAD
jgi:Arylsulfotransferase (ASST)